MNLVDDALDFDLDEDTVAARELAAEIFADLADVDRVRHVEGAGGHDDRLWATCASSGLLGLALPEDVGGAGLGMTGLAAVLEQQGRRVAPVRLGAVVAGALLPLARFATAEQRATWLDPTLEGTALVTGAWATDALGEVVRLAATPAGDGWSLTGRLAGVPAAPVATGFLVPVTLDGRPEVALVSARQQGVVVETEHVTDQGSSGSLVLTDVTVTEADLLAGSGVDVAAWTLLRLRVAQAAVQVGVCAEALATTAAYTSQRQQFGRPLSTNQAVTQRAADAHLDVDALRLTTQRAAWLLDGGLEHEAESAALVAAWWAADAGLRVLHTTQHLHGGMGADIDYPIHRYFLWGRQIAFTLGSAGALASELGALLPEAPAVGAPA